MASIKVMLYTSKVLSNGEHPIMLRIIKERKPKYKNRNTRIIEYSKRNNRMYFLSLVYNKFTK